MSVLAIAEMYAISARRGELAQRLTDLQAWAAGEPGCRRYTCAATLADATTFVLVSEWDSEESLDAHHRSARFEAFQFGLDGILARPSELDVFAVGAVLRPVNTRPMDPRDAD